MGQNTQNVYKMNVYKTLWLLSWEWMRLRIGKWFTLHAPAPIYDCHIVPYLPTIKSLTVPTIPRSCLSSIDNGGSGALVVFWTIFAPELSSIDNGPGAFFTLLRTKSPPITAHLFFGGSGVLAHLDHFLVHFGATGGASGLGAPFLHKCDSGALLAHTPSRPSSILGRLWHTPQVAHRLY